MPFFRYEAYNHLGAAINGRIEANDESGALKQLQEYNKYTVFSIEEIKNEGISRTNFELGRENIVYYFTEQMSSLLNSGIKLGEVLDILSKTSKKGKEKVLFEEIYSDIKKGFTLSEALGRKRAYFDDAYISIIEAGEEGGFIEETFKRLLSNLKENREIKNFLISNMIYPLILIIVSVMAMIIMFIFILPRFVKLYDNYGKSIPRITEIIIQISKFMTQNLLIISLFIGMVFVLVFKYLKTEKGKYDYDSMFFKIALFKNVYSKIVVVKLFRTVGNMLKSGVPIIRALDIAKFTVKNKLVEEEIESIKQKITKGDSFSLAIKESIIFPEITYFMISTGEKSGKLSDIMIEISNSSEETLKKEISFLMKIFEPGIILIMGIVIGILIYSMIIPIMNLSKIIK